MSKIEAGVFHTPEGKTRVVNYETKAEVIL
jgi:hypothetical protein